MIVRLGTAPRIAALDFEGFQKHWRTSHADVVSHLPGLRRYQQFHAVLEGGKPLLPYPGFDACSALCFDTVEAMDVAFESEEFLQAVQADEAEFVDKTLFRGVVGSWQSDDEADLGSTAPFQLLSFLVSDRGTSPQELADRLVGSSEAAVSGSIVADHAMHEGRFPVTADVVRVIGYTDIASALEGTEVTRRAVGPTQIIGEHFARIVEVPLGAAAAGPDNERTQA